MNSEPNNSIHSQQNSMKIERSAYIWNTASGLLMAFQSVIMLAVLTRVNSLAAAGVFTIAYANANLFLNLGKYGVRNYQVSDVTNRFSFPTYLCGRALTTLAMVVFGSAWAIWSSSSVGYTADKLATIIVMLVFKAVDSLEDVFHGDYQRVGRLDIGARVMTLRMLSMIIVFAGLTVASGNLLFSLSVTTLFTALFFCAETIWIKRRYSLPRQPQNPSNLARATLCQLKDCFPVFLASFLLFYIGNAPKYAIDASMDDVAQAYYGFIAMPVFVVGLLASFIYNPIIASLAEDWANNARVKFAKRMLLQVAVIFVITAACVAGAWILGVPVLNLLYNANLEPYKLDLIVLIVGGGFLALATLFTTGITIIRRQRQLMPGYIAVSVAAFACSPIAVNRFGISGASWIYLVLMALLSAWFAIVLIRGVQAKLAG